MRSFVVTGSAARQKTDCAIVGLHEGAAPAGAAAQLDSMLGGRIARLLKRGDFRAVRRKSP